MPTVERTSGVGIITPSGDINHAEMARVKNAIGDLLRDLVPRVVLDLTEVDHINYMTLGVLVERAGCLKKSGGDLRLAGSSEYLTKILRFSGVDHLFPMFATVAEAAESFGGRMVSTPSLAAGTSGSWVP